MSEYKLPDLPYSSDALEPHYSAEGLEIHHQKHHAGYVKKLNKVVDDLESARSAGEHRWIRQLQSELAFNLSGHRLHSLFWTSLDPNSSGEIPVRLKKMIDENFGGVDPFKAQFKAAATSIQGSGWCALTIEPESGRLYIEQLRDHENNQAAGTRPVLILDMWEHAFYLQYQNQKGKWIDAFWEIANWNNARDLINAISSERG